ncbi:luciferin 4-monooxygenase-like isoform X2 [Photinus pyralis]|uniref:luciferin 4-monooxygenase-like isoform X2 n=1 Tax=Photinus pyralis TaxID=7054 RepID=UPI0012672B78|nr:luciferin 4-monooxygenase-like isoform X2 [Photinus pyralis]
MVLDSRGIGYVYYHAMRNHGRKIAQFDTVTKDEQTYDELLRHCVGAAQAFQNLGLKPGDFISVCSTNHIDVCVPFVSSLFTGVINAAVDPSMSEQEIVHLLSEVGPKIIFVDKDAVVLIEGVVEKLKTKPLIVVFGENEKYSSFCQFVTSISADSGTTAMPKGICHSHRSMLSNKLHCEFKDLTCIAWFTNPYWMTFYFGIQRCFLNGIRRYILPPFTGTDTWALLGFRIDALTIGTLQALTFVHLPTPAHTDLGNLVQLQLSGLPLLEGLARKLHEKLPKTRISNVYGQSELFGWPFAFASDIKGRELAEKFSSSVGVPVDGVDWKIVDLDTGKVLGQNQCGELMLKAGFQFKGYLNYDSSDTIDSDELRISSNTRPIAYYRAKSNAFFSTTPSLKMPWFSVCHTRRKATIPWH